MSFKTDMFIFAAFNICHGAEFEPITTPVTEYKNCSCSRQALLGIPPILKFKIHFALLALELNPKFEQSFECMYLQLSKSVAGKM